MGRHMLDRSWNRQHANIGGALQDIAVDCLEIMPSENSSLCTLYDSGNVTVERDKALDDH